MSQADGVIRPRVRCSWSVDEEAVVELGFAQIIGYGWKMLSVA